MTEILAIQKTRTPRETFDWIRLLAVKRKPGIYLSDPSSKPPPNSKRNKKGNKEILKYSSRWREFANNIKISHHLEPSDHPESSSTPSPFVGWSDFVLFHFLKISTPGIFFFNKKIKHPFRQSFVRHPAHPMSYSQQNLDLSVQRWHSRSQRVTALQLQPASLLRCG